MNKVVVAAPAKLNLALDVTGFAPNGYHTVDMVMQAISLYETVEIMKSNGYSLRCPGSLVPTDDKNTATKAAALFFQETGLLAGADIVIHKKVPTRAGMAGGSADAAAVLTGLNRLYNARLSLQELCEIGANIGADVPFALTGGTARVTGIGEILSPLPALPHCWFAIAMPPGGVSTPAAYARYDELGSPVHPNLDAVEGAIRQGDLQALARQMHNALEYSSGTTRTSEIRTVLDQHGAIASMMTGSGAAVFGIFTEELAAKKAVQALQPLAPRRFIAKPVTHGPKFL